MKKLLVLLLTFFTLNSCEKDAEIIGIDAEKKLPKVDVCHYDADTDTWKTLSINENAMKAHLKHGDYEGACEDVSDVDSDGDGYTIGDGDCDDNNPKINPGAEEICDGLDNDCVDGANFPGELVDADNDGVISCYDCDDNDPNNYPGNNEVCDGKDNDCDGIIDQSDSPLGVLCPQTPHVLRTDCFGAEGCKIMACEDGWFDANGIYEDGCEESISGGEAVPFTDERDGFD